MRLGNDASAYRYRIPDSDQVLVIAAAVAQTFERYRQDRDSAEAGGLLFAEFLLPTIIIREATPPNSLDKRSRNGFVPCRKIHNELITQRFELGLHFVGEWHTHPEPRPFPSALDLESMYDSFIKSKHELSAFVLIIVGSRSPGLSLWVSLHSRIDFVHLARLDGGGMAIRLRERQFGQ